MAECRTCGSPECRKTVCLRIDLAAERAVAKCLGQTDAYKARIEKALAEVDRETEGEGDVIG